MVLLDSSVLIDFLSNKKKAIDAINNFPETDLSISVITYAEIGLGFALMSGKAEEQYKKFNQVIENNKITLLPVDKSVAKSYVDIQTTLKKQGKALSQFDGLIAATAVVHKLPVLTTDEDFKRVEGLKIAG
jgi:predicted nucleic acid-binding protein